MTDRDLTRERGSNNNNDWDWEYYEYSYYPYYGSNYEYMMYPYSRSRSNYGRYSGVGPRGYQRSDERIEEDINDRLMWHGYIDATDIQVEVNDGVVTLNGSVDDRRQKRMAENVVDSVSGVQDVNNNLSIQNTGSNRSREQGKNDRRIRPGMEVVGEDGTHVGEVKQVRSHDFLVDRTMDRDIYVPMDACQIVNDQVRLNVRSAEVDNQGWQKPELLGTGSAEKKR